MFTTKNLIGLMKPRMYFTRIINFVQRALGGVLASGNFTKLLLRDSLRFLVTKVFSFTVINTWVHAQEGYGTSLVCLSVS